MRMVLKFRMPRKALRRLVKEVLGTLLVAVEECIVNEVPLLLVESRVQVLWTVPLSLGRKGALTTYRWTRVFVPVSRAILLTLAPLSSLQTCRPMLSRLRNRPNVLVAAVKLPGMEIFTLERPATTLFREVPPFLISLILPTLSRPH